jgi:hypothetical protein
MSAISWGPVLVVEEAVDFNLMKVVPDTVNVVILT